MNETLGSLEIKNGIVNLVVSLIQDKINAGMDAEQAKQEVIDWLDQSIIKTIGEK